MTGAPIGLFVQIYLTSLQSCTRLNRLYEKEKLAPNKKKMYRYVPHVSVEVPVYHFINSSINKTVPLIHIYKL